MIYKKIAIKVDGYKETADLYTYFLDNSIEMNINRKRPVVVICPGGGYTMTSDREAEPIAMQYLAKGYHAVILRYSVEPARYPLALLQLAKSVAFLRENAAEFHIDVNKIVVQGFSAGGHLAASLGVFWKKNFIAETLGIDSKMLQSFILIRIKLFCRAFPQVVIWQQVLAFSGRKILLHRHLG
jgi:acetyl esterase/lipase